eukprot:gene24536-39111_t
MPAPAARKSMLFSAGGHNFCVGANAGSPDAPADVVKDLGLHDLQAKSCPDRGGFPHDVTGPLTAGMPAGDRKKWPAIKFYA